MTSATPKTAAAAGTAAALVKRRIAAAIRGAFVADAASMGTHWIYDPKEMIEAVASVDAPEFRSPPRPKYYSGEEFPGHYDRAGMLSPYGEQLLFVAEFVAEATNRGEELEGGPMSEEMLRWATSFGGRPDSATNAFVENMQTNGKPWPDCGADDDQAHIYMKIVPVVGRYAGSPELIDRVAQAIRVHQNNDRAVAFGIASARLLEAVVLGAPSLLEALDTVERNIKDDLNDDGAFESDVRDAVTQAFARGKRAGLASDETTLDDVLREISHEIMKGKEDSPFYDLAGRSCALPGSFIGPIAIFYKYASSASTDEAPMLGLAFAPALRENILASGDTCSRSVFIGSVLAAAGAGVPNDWVEKMDSETLRRIDAAIDAIVASLAK